MYKTNSGGRRKDDSKSAPSLEYVLITFKPTLEVTEYFKQKFAIGDDVTKLLYYQFKHLNQPYWSTIEKAKQLLLIKKNGISVKEEPVSHETPRFSTTRLVVTDHDRVTNKYVVVHSSWLEHLGKQKSKIQEIEGEEWCIVTVNKHVPDRYYFESTGYVVTVRETKSVQVSNNQVIQTILQDLTVPAFRTKFSSVPSSHDSGFQVKIGPETSIHGTYSRIETSTETSCKYLSMKWELVRGVSDPRELLVASLPHSLQDHLLMCDIAGQLLLDRTVLGTYTYNWVWQGRSRAVGFRREKDKKQWHNFGVSFLNTHYQCMLLQVGYKEESKYTVLENKVTETVANSTKEKKVTKQFTDIRKLKEWKAALRYLCRHMVCEFRNSKKFELVSVEAFRTGTVLPNVQEAMKHTNVTNEWQKAPCVRVHTKFRRGDIELVLFVLAAGNPRYPHYSTSKNFIQKQRSHKLEEWESMWIPPDQSKILTPKELADFERALSQQVRMRILNQPPVPGTNATFEQMKGQKKHVVKKKKKEKK